MQARFNLGVTEKELYKKKTTDPQSTSYLQQKQVTKKQWDNDGQINKDDSAQLLHQY